MGLSLKLSMFREVDPQRVYDAYARFHADLGRPLRTEGEPDYAHKLHDVNGGWAIIFHGIGWEAELRRDALRAVSRALGCIGMFAFVYDGDYWGYELVRDGRGCDQFVSYQEPSEADRWFPGKDMSGNPAMLAAQFDCVDADTAAAYLVRQPDASEYLGPDRTQWPAQWQAMRDRLDVRARPGDEFTRFDDCAILDFLRLLRVGVELRPMPQTPDRPMWRAVTLATPVVREFWLPGSRRPRRHRPGDHQSQL